MEGRQQDSLQSKLNGAYDEEGTLQGTGWVREV
jgi:hypothetical protein